MKLTIAGCGDAFGSGGRLQSCYHVETPGTRFLIDCGATALIGLRQWALDVNRVETIFISHLHGDHFAGLVWWLLYAQHVSQRTAPLMVAGPPGIEARFKAAAEVLFPGSSTTARRFDMGFAEYRLEHPMTIGTVTVVPFEVKHPSGAPSCALRFETEDKVLAFSGDTQWVDTLLPVSRDADLFMIECYAFDNDVRYHMSWRTIERKLPDITARRVLLTHMNAEMLANRHLVADPRVALAEDGLVLDV